MSFQTIPTYMFYTDSIKDKKGDGLFLAHNIIQKKHIAQERASVFTSKGSITLEAAIVIPIFFFAMICMCYLFEIMAIQTSVRSALQSVGKQVAKEAYLSPLVLPSEIEQEMIAILGRENLEQSIIVDGADGLDCSHSASNMGTSVIDLNVQYQIEIPVLMFRIPVRTYEERLRIKGWTGYAAGGTDSLEEEVVYVTEFGLVYHKDLYCTYLELSVRSVSAEEMEDLRNESGGIYYPCESCDEYQAGGFLFVTNYGNRYHTTLECQKLKRNVYAVPLKDINGLGGCSKCGK